MASPAVSVVHQSDLCASNGCIRSKFGKFSTCCAACGKNGQLPHTDDCSTRHNINSEKVKVKVIKINFPQLAFNNNNAHVAVAVFNNIPQKLIDNLMSQITEQITSKSCGMYFTDGNGVLFCNSDINSGSSVFVHGEITQLRDRILEIIYKYPEIASYLDKSRFVNGVAPTCSIDIGMTNFFDKCQMMAIVRATIHLIKIS
jgi:hypothetical protein